MNHSLAQLAKFIGNGTVHDHVVNWLQTVPGLPPIVQTVHIVCIACIMGSIVMIDLRVLGVAVRSQSPQEMLRRLMPWMWWSLALLLASGAMFVIARPRRYFANPIFGYKMSLLALALFFSVALRWSLGRQANSNANVIGAKLCATASLLSWLGVILAGRWIAYVDYIFPQE